MKFILLLGNLTYVNSVQPWKAPLLIMLLPMVVTDSGIIIDVNAIQFLNALVPIVVNKLLVGNVIDTNE